MSNTDRSKKAFAFRISKDKLNRYRNISAAEKLDWLEEANRFVADFVSEEKLKRWRDFLETKDSQQ